LRFAPMFPPRMRRGRRLNLARAVTQRPMFFVAAVGATCIACIQQLAHNGAVSFAGGHWFAVPALLWGARAPGGFHNRIIVPRAAGGVGSNSDLSTLRVADLKKRLKEYGLPVSGKKADLLRRLQDYLEASVEKLEEAHDEPEEINTYDAPFYPGDAVEVRSNEEWKAATVQRDHRDGTFTITWQDGFEARDVPAEHMRLLKKAKQPAHFFAGDVVEAMWEDDEVWYPAKLLRNEGDGSFTVKWDEDGEESAVSTKHLRHPAPRRPLRGLQPGKQLRGTVTRSFNFGTFVDVGAVRDGLVVPFHMHAGNTPSPAAGDVVEVLREDGTWRPATIQEPKGTLGYFVTFDDNEEEEQEEVAAKDVRLTRVASLEEGASVDVWVNNVARVGGEQRISLTMVKSKVGTQPPLPSTGLTPFQATPHEDWLDATVAANGPFGLSLSVQPPGGGRSVPGWVHKIDIRDGFIEDPTAEAQPGQEVRVRVKAVDVNSGRLSLTMRG